jgi:3-(3-hydroxy-phenyl)propionate hydroxylase
VRVAIIGAGPTGLVAANLLGQAGIETLLLERNAGLSSDPKAITIDDEGLRICQALGLIDEILAHTRLAVEAHYVSQGKYLIKVRPAQRSYGYPQISTFHQPDFERFLCQGLTRFPCVSLLFGHTVVALKQATDGVTLDLLTANQERQAITCAYVLACDGGRSTLRRLTGVALRTPDVRHLISSAQQTQTKSQRRTTHTQRWLVVDSIEANEHSSPIIFFCNPARPAVTVPAPGGRRRWEFLLKPREQAEQFLHDDTIAQLIKQTSASLPAGNRSLEQAYLAPIVRKAVYTFHATVAETFSSGHVFFLGDAAHLMPPFGGQGMNSGLRDAYNLCWKLQLVLQKNVHTQLLTTYQQERLPHVTQMIFFSALLGALIMPTKRPHAQIRDTAIHSLSKIPLLRQQLTEMNVKPQPKYQRGLLLPRRLTIIPAQTGQLLPQPLIQTANDQPITVQLDQILGQRFALLQLYERATQPFAAAQDAIWTQLDVQFISILPTQAAATSIATPHRDVTTIIDSESILHRLLRNRHNVLLLLRPDHYIMGIFDVSSMRKVESQLAHLFPLKRPT